MKTWQGWRRGMAVALAAGVVALGLSAMPSPATAQETIACVSNRLGLVRIVEDESQCKFWEHAQTIGGGDGSGVKFVFVTSETYQGDIPAPDCTIDCATGIDRARFECNRLASAVGLPGEYEPWLSDSTSNAVDRFMALGADGPWFNVNGDLIAASLAGLATLKNGTDYLYSAIQYDELGVAWSNGGDLFAPAWTATRAVTGGYIGPSCLDWDSSSSSEEGTIGSAHLTTNTWTRSGTASCNDGIHIYCFQHQ